MAVHKKTSLAHKTINIIVPIRHNDYRPWIARIPGIFTVAIILVLLHILLNGFTIRTLNINNSSEQMRNDLLKAINNIRANDEVGPLKSDPRLTNAAQKKAEHMVANNYWAHVSPDGVGAWSFIHQEKYYYSISAENLARGFRTAKGVVGGWQASQPHKEAMLNRKYSEVGFGVARGSLSGEATTIYVALFAKPLSGAALASPEVSQKLLSLQGQSERHLRSSETIDFSLLKPLSPGSTLTLPGKIALAVLFGLTLIYISQHVLIIRRQVKWQPKAHEHPLFRLVVVGLIILFIVATSFGSIA